MVDEHNFEDKELFYRFRQDGNEQNIVLCFTDVCNLCIRSMKIRTTPSNTLWWVLKWPSVAYQSRIKIPKNWICLAVVQHPQIESSNLRELMNLPSVMLINGLVVLWYKTSLLRWKCHTGSRFAKMLKIVFLYHRQMESDWVYWKSMVSLWGNLQSCSRVS